MKPLKQDIKYEHPEKVDKKLAKLVSGEVPERISENLKVSKIKY